MVEWPLGRVAIGLILLGCGGQEQAGSKRAEFTCSPVTLPAGELLIDDFEDGNLALAPVGILHGAWYVNNDGTGTQVPSPEDVAPASLIVTDDVGKTRTQALHTSGAGFSRWGAFAAARLNGAGAQACSVDLSAHSRLSLRVKGAGSLRANLGTQATTPIVDGGECATDACSDYGASVQLTPEWRALSLRFDELAQPAWADPADFDPSTALRLSFWAEGADFDFWVDDIRLLP